MVREFRRYRRGQAAATGNVMKEPGWPSTPNAPARRRRRRRRVLAMMERNERVRRRDGAFRWSLYRDLEQAEIFLETFVVVSWAEHLRQHEHLTRGDRELEDVIGSYTQRPDHP